MDSNKRKEVKKIKTQNLININNSETFFDRDFLQKSLLSNGWTKMKFKRKMIK